MVEEMFKNIEANRKKVVENCDVFLPAIFYTSVEELFSSASNELEGTKRVLRLWTLIDVFNAGKAQARMEMEIGSQD